MNGALVYLFTFTNIENISSHRNKVFIYKISVTTVNFELNKRLLILIIIKKYSENYISFYLISIAAEDISEDRKMIAKFHIAKFH